MPEGISLVLRAGSRRRKGPRPAGGGGPGAAGFTGRSIASRRTTSATNEGQRSAGVPAVAAAPTRASFQIASMERALAGAGWTSIERRSSPEGERAGTAISQSIRPVVVTGIASSPGEDGALNHCDSQRHAGRAAGQCRAIGKRPGSGQGVMSGGSRGGDGTTFAASSRCRKRAAGLRRKGSGMAMSHSHKKEYPIGNWTHGAVGTAAAVAAACPSIVTQKPWSTSTDGGLAGESGVPVDAVRAGSIAAQSGSALRVRAAGMPGPERQVMPASESSRVPLEHAAIGRPAETATRNKSCPGLAAPRRLSGAGDGASSAGTGSAPQPGRGAEAAMAATGSAGVARDSPSTGEGSRTGRRRTRTARSGEAAPTGGRTSAPVDQSPRTRAAGSRAGADPATTACEPATTSPSRAGLAMAAGMAVPGRGANCGKDTGSSAELPLNSWNLPAMSMAPFPGSTMGRRRVPGRASPGRSRQSGRCASGAGATAAVPVSCHCRASGGTAPAASRVLGSARFRRAGSRSACQREDLASDVRRAGAGSADCRATGSTMAGVSDRSPDQEGARRP
jgi:hypothetical protein